MIRLLFLLALASRAQPSCLPRLAAELEELRGGFPRLAGLSIRIEAYAGAGDSYLDARPRGFWREPAKRVYEIRVSDRLCADPPAEDAVRAILVHELAHLDAYAAMSRGALLALGWAYLVSPEGPRVEAFEKAADDAAAELGRAEGLALYREWLYPRVGPAAAARKRRLYRTPEELRRRLTDRKKSAIISR